MSQRRKVVCVVFLLVVGFAARVYLGWNWPSLYWPDEIFQSLEQAHRLVFGYGIVPWEYEKGIRSWLFPGFLSGVVWLTAPLGAGSTGYLMGTIVVLSLISMVPCWAAYRWADQEMDGVAVVLATLAPAVWVELVYFAPKAFFEVFTAHIFAGALYLSRFSRGSRWRPWVGGMLLGLCGGMRLQLIPAVGVGICIASWMADDPYRRFTLLTTGAAAGVGIVGLVDLVVWGVPFQSVVANYYVNLVEGRAADWGTSPWWQYADWMWSVSPILTVLIALGVGVGLYRFPVMAWPAVVVFVTHSYVGHKEYRFLYPFLVLSAMLVGLCGGRVVDAVRRGNVVGRGESGRLWSVVLGVVFGGLIFAVSVVNAFDFRLHDRGGRPPMTNWTLQGGKLHAMRDLSLEPEVCGVGLHGFGAYIAGGYSYLHHDVPIVEFGTGRPLADQLAERGSRVNYVLSLRWDRDGRDSLGRFSVRRCYQPYGLCVLERSGDCRDAS